jgi:hypothetical protein
MNSGRRHAPSSSQPDAAIAAVTFDDGLDNVAARAKSRR